MKHLLVSFIITLSCNVMGADKADSTCSFIKKEITRLNLCVDGGIPMIEKELSSALDQNNMFAASGNGSDLDSKQIALTFDDGPNAVTTECMRVALKQCGVRAHFLQVGRQVANPKNRDVIKRLLADGHKIGSHTWSHEDINKLKKKGALSEIDRQVAESHQQIETILGELLGENGSVFTPYFRFPYGSGHTSDVLNKYLKENHMTSFFWRMMTMDAGTCSTSSCVAEKTISNIKKVSGNKGILLGHDSHPWTSNAMPKILDYLKRNGYSIVVYTDARYLKPHNEQVVSIKEVQ